MKKTICFEIDENIAHQAEAIYFSIGMDIEAALSVFMRRTVLENRLPVDMNKAASSTRFALPSTEEQPNKSTNLPAEKRRPEKRENRSITPQMTETLWQSFKEYRSKGSDIRKTSDKVAEITGMNPGSAFIYMNILNNLMEGKPNTRNMKMKDLLYYMDKIKSEYGDEQFRNALGSLKQSVNYWDSELFGSFADRVRDYLKANKM